MATTTETPLTNGSAHGSSDVPEFKIVARVAAIPVVHDGLYTAEHILRSTPLTASIYDTVGGIAARSYNLATPVLSRTKPLVDRADGYANSGLDMVENKFPYPFKTPTNEMYNQSYAVVKQIYDDRIAPYVHNAVLQRAIDNLYEINKSLSSNLSHAKESIVAQGHNAADHAHALAQALMDQLYQLNAHGKDLPPIIRESINTAYTDVKGIVSEKDKTTTEKAAEIGKYVQANLQPAIDKTMQVLTTTKESVETTAGETADAVKEKTDQATK